MSSLKSIPFFLIASFFTLMSVTSVAQGELEVFGQIKSEKTDLKTVLIRIQEDQGPFQEIPFKSRTGKFDLALPLDHVYTFEFSQNGCITKKIEISTICPSDFKETVFDPFYFSVQLDLYTETPGIDTLFYNAPVGKVYFAEEYQQFGYDREYILFVQNKINRAVEQALIASIEKSIQDSAQLEIDRRIAQEALILEAKLQAEALRKAQIADSILLATQISDSLIALELASTVTVLPAEEATILDTASNLLAENKIIVKPEAAEITREAIADVESSPSLQSPKKEITKAEKPRKTASTTQKEVKEVPKVAALPKVRPKEETIIPAPTRKVRPIDKPTTTIPQFKKRPEPKTFENTMHTKGLWTRIFINDGGRVTKYTMIQYNSGKTAYYIQDQYQTDSLQISRSIFMRVINQ